jgi:hypothetical protein
MSHFIFVQENEHFFNFVSPALTAPVRVYLLQIKFSVYVNLRSNIGGPRAVSNSAFGHNDPAVIHADAYGSSSSSASYAPMLSNPPAPPMQHPMYNQSSASSAVESTLDLHQPELVHANHPNPHSINPARVPGAGVGAVPPYPPRMVTGGVIVPGATATDSLIPSREDVPVQLPPINPHPYSHLAAGDAVGGGQRFHPNLSIGKFRFQFESPPLSSV